MLAFERCGNAAQPAVVFLHGFLGSGAEWNVVGQSLRDRFFCIAPDLPGHGGSLASVRDTGEAARAVLEVLDTLGVGRCAVVGYSMGGRLGLYLALQHPDRVERAVLESASPGLETEAERAERRRRDDDLAAALENEPLEDFLRCWYEQPLFASLKADPIRFERLIRWRLQNDPRRLAASLRALGTGRQVPLWDRLEANRVPLRILAGELDAKYCGIARRMAALCPVCDVRIVPACGHNVHFEDPVTYTRLVKEFLEDR